MRARYDAELPPSISIVRCPGRPVILGMGLVVRIARPASLAIWHRRHSYRKPNRNQSPNRRHFASLDLDKHAVFLGGAEMTTNLSDDNSRILTAP